MKFIKKIDLTRIGLLAGAIAIILLLLPRVDHQSFVYELNQPWRYPLLTADFDMPILRDSASAKVLRDSIDAGFIPFVKRDNEVAQANEERLRTALTGKIDGTGSAILSGLLKEVYTRGVVEAKVYDHIHSTGKAPRLRVAGKKDGAHAVESIDASEMLSPSKAYDFIDSVYSAVRGSVSGRLLEGDVAKAVNMSLNVNVVSDTAANKKFLDQECLVVNGALGVIKRGQRIVDRGEIVTPQIYTNLNTYVEMMERNQNASRAHTYFYIGQGLYVLMCLLTFYLFLSSYRPAYYASAKKMVFLMTFITLFEVFSILMFEYFANGLAIVPFAAVPVIVMIFFDSRTAIFSLIITILIAALVSAYPLNFIFIETVVGVVATLSIRQLSQRSQLLRTAFFTFLTYVIGYTVLCLVTEGNLDNFHWRIIGIYGVNAVILSFAYILILIIEKIFGFTSTVTLVELSDINNPLLRRLAEDAPGTFQHSMQVSTLASEAARAIGANTQLVRTGALYHDIGKMESPVFFTENQHGVNPHSGLNPETSAHKIISHVTGGLALAAKKKLPEVIRNFITEHHGRSVTKYFYNTAVNESGGEPVDASKFQYPGPNPRSKETAIVMMADSVEAASRSLKDYSPQAISALVDKIIDTQMADGMFKESPISFKDVETVKETFKKRLSTIYHSRVAYPEIRKEAEAPKKEADSSGKE